MVVAISTLKTVFPSNSRKDCEDRFSIQFKEGLEGNFLKIINQMDCTISVYCTRLPTSEESLNFAFEFEIKETWKEVLPKPH